MNNQPKNLRLDIIKPPKKLLRSTGKALTDFNMINEGDRVLLGLSGGKDSLSLLHLLIHFQRHAPIHFDIGAVTIDPQSGSFDPSPLIPYMQSLGIDYHFKPEPIMEMAEDKMEGNSYCAFCARIKRGVMYTVARENNYTVLALGQHLDDLAESFLMSAFYGGKLKTMKANYLIDAEDLRVIRPMVYVREKELAAFAKESELPVIVENCPACFDMPTQREHMKQLLAQEEQTNKNVFGSLLTAMKPLIADSNKQKIRS
ncbi:MAG TPA: tRNA 2-thiocytidine biosynthesis protein TtcA [Leucothrix mucor]|nr:tRNA 2-thiocytidine biosynthesis protein TtcA [Leucothrix mucor]